MSEQYYPPGWDEARVKRLIDHYDNMTDDEWVAEDEAARKAGESQVLVLKKKPAANGKVAPKKRKASKIKPSKSPKSKGRSKSIKSQEA